MVTFEHKNVTVADPHLHVGGHISQVGRDGHPNPVRFKYKAYRIGGIVGDSEWGNGDVANQESSAGGEVLYPGQPAWVVGLGFLCPRLLLTELRGILRARSILRGGHNR